MTANISRTKHCSRCNAEFQCLTEKCWCSELPNIMPMDGKGDCLCPECLKAAIEAAHKNLIL